MNLQQIDEQIAALHAERREIEIEQRTIVLIAKITALHRTENENLGAEGIDDLGQRVFIPLYDLQPYHLGMFVAQYSDGDYSKPSPTKPV